MVLSFGPVRPRIVLLGSLLTAVFLAVFIGIQLLRAQGPEDLPNLAAGSARVASAVGVVLTDFIEETNKVKNKDYYEVDQKLFNGFASDLRIIHRDIVGYLKASKPEAVRTRTPLSPMDEELLREAFRCTGCTRVGGDQIPKSSYPPKDSHELLGVMQMRLEFLIELCGYHMKVMKMDRNAWAQFERHLLLLRGIAVVYS
jgi:hypothetical protein